MQASELLLTRQSAPRLIAPGPNEQQLDFILNAGARVPDHGALTPWEFILAQGDGLTRLADIFINAAKANNADDAFIEKAAKMPMRAPLVIIVVAKTQHHPKVPVLEQQIAAGCAVMAMQQAAFSIGLGAVWRTGGFAFDANVHQSLGLNEADQIVGFLYVGTPAVKAPIKALKPGRQFSRQI
ncbi:NAD(P)H nitroreductase [Shewanella aestuarii]|uniref:Putative NAD(P)H nitroreductase n=1 Tax=Shewanella aestuarii TaxID=1028752 RepID=A0A6G9QIS3_9GAMM|nr:NAD(P)H nitroreductase [Shewanella aestuarii]QIR14298.1 NAD(P)H nitroreductase [Shewanella aestuarii]